MAKTKPLTAITAYKQALDTLEQLQPLFKDDWKPNFTWYSFQINYRHPLTGTSTFPPAINNEIMARLMKQVPGIVQDIVKGSSGLSAMRTAAVLEFNDLVQSGDEAAAPQVQEDAA